MPDSSFPETLPGLYLKRGLQLMGGNEESYLKLLLKFGKNQKDTIQKIKYCLADNDPMGARRLIHTLTGIAGNIGADELYASIIDLGEAIKKNRTSEWDGKTDVAQALMTQLCASIESLADKYNTAKESGNKEAHRAPDQDKTIDM
ncbi:MAG: Hpt domain-containing protein, partial [Spirochaetaceae bacterium]